MIGTMLLSASMLTSQNGWASDCGQAEQLIQACDQALKACTQANGSCNAVREKQQQIITEQNAEIEKLYKSQSGILNSPVFWFVTGVAIGAITVSVIGK